MKYVKLIAKPDTWFQEGTEVWHYDEPIILVRGIRISDDNPNENALGYKPNCKRIDGESCFLDEFDIETVDEDKDFTDIENQ